MTAYLYIHYIHVEMHIYKSILCISLHVSVWILQIYTYIYVCMYVCVYIYSYLYLHIHMSQILTKCKVISYSHCKFKKRLHPSFKKNFHAPLQTIRFLSSALKKSSHSPFKKTLRPPFRFKKRLYIPHSRRSPRRLARRTKTFATDLAQTHVSLCM